MDRSGGPAVDLDLRIGHDPLEDDADAPVLPFPGDGERMFVGALLVRLLFVVTVVEGPESLAFPIGGDRDDVPLPRPAARRALELPFHRVVRTRPGEVLPLGSGGFVGRDVSRAGHSVNGATGQSGNNAKSGDDVSHYEA